MGRPVRGKEGEEVFRGGRQEVVKGRAMGRCKGKCREGVGKEWCTNKVEGRGRPLSEEV